MVDKFSFLLYFCNLFFLTTIILNYLNEYTIPFRSLNEGHHQYEFKIDKLFFACFEGSELNKSDVLVKLDFENASSFLCFDIDISGKVEVICDRCLDEFDITIKGNHKLYVRFGETNEEQADDVIVIPQSETSINIAKYIYEYVHLNVPYRRVHESRKDCNSETIKKLEEVEVKEVHEVPDPRWDKLKDLLTKND